MIQTPPMNNGPGRPGGTSLDPLRPDTGGAARREPGADDAQRFSEMMRGDDQNARAGRQDEGRRPGGDGAGDGQSQGQDRDADAPLSSPFDLFRPAALSSGGASGVAMGAAGKTADLQQIVQAVAERVLVSDGSDGAQEVRIQLKDSVLPGGRGARPPGAGALRGGICQSECRQHALPRCTTRCSVRSAGRPSEDGCRGACHRVRRDEHGRRDGGRALAGRICGAAVR